jgi:hypothetical protein
VGRKRCSSFSRTEIEAHLKAHHGRCPPELMARFVELIAAREWRPKLTIGKAFAVTSQAHVRHTMTDYDRLLRIPGLTRDEALLITRPEVMAIIATWATPPEGTEAASSRASDLAGAGGLETGSFSPNIPDVPTELAVSSPICPKSRAEAGHCG